MSYYECMKCGHITKQKIEMKRHLNRKFKCKNLKKYCGNDEDLLIQSLVKKISEETLESLKKNAELVHLQDNTTQNSSSFKCESCNQVFDSSTLLQKHVHEVCQKHTMNITNNNTLNQQNNVININLKIIKPFDDDWDLSNIDQTLKNILVLSSMKYTKTLEQILNNDTNLNVFIDDQNAETGIVYKNDIEKFKLMTISDIIDKSMDKLHKHLTDFHGEIQNNNEYSINNEYLQEEKDIIEKKFNEFKNNNMIQEKVQHFLTKIYNSKKEESLTIFKELMNEQEEKNLLDGY